MRKASLYISLLGGLLLAACDDDGNEPNPTLSIAVSEAITLVQGQSGSATITVTRGGGYDDEVDLTVSNLPTGVTAVLDPVQIPAGSGAGTSTLTLTADATTTPGTAQYTIEAEATTRAGLVANATGSVTVNEAPNFTLAADPTTVEVAVGGSGTSNVTITRTGGFAEAVNLSVANLPTGVTAAFDNAAPTGNAAVLTLTADATAVAGTTTVALTGTGTPGTKTVDLTLTVTAPANGFSIALDPAALTLAAGGTGTSTVTVNKTGSFAGPVNLSVTNLPTGVTAAFDPASATTTSALTVTVDAAVAAGDIPLTVRGSADGLPDSDATLTLTVGAAVNGFTLSADPATINLAPGGTATSTISVIKTGTFTAPVNLTITGLPTGVTAAFDPAAASPPASSARRDVTTTSVLTLTAEATAAPATSPIVVHGNAEGQTEQTIDVSLVVATPGSGNTSFKFCDLDDLPVWLAYQNGTGAWTQSTGSVAGDGTTYSFDITESTGGIAWVTGNATDGFETNVVYGTQAELGTFGTSQCEEAPDASRTLNGSIAGVGATDQVNISMGGGVALANGALLNFTLNGVRNGPADLLATQSTVAAGPPIAITPVKMIIRRALDIPDGGTIPVLDFAAAEAFVPQTAAITLNNLGTDTPITFLGYVTPTTSGPLYTTPGAAGATQTVYGVPAAQQQADDLHALTVFTTSATPGDVRGYFSWFKTLADMPVTLGPVLTAPTVTSLATTPYPRYQAVGPVQAEYDDSFVFSLTQINGTSRGTTITATKGFLAGATNYTLAIPDLTAAGYQALWGLQTGTAVEHSTAAFGFSSGSTLPVVEGGTAGFASKGGQVTP